MHERFPATYAESREKFLAVAHVLEQRILLRMETHCLRNEQGQQLYGPKGETLTTDIAHVGPSCARNVLFTESGRHGAELRAMSQAQINLMRQVAEDGLPPNVRLTMVHAINPWGGAYDTRENEGETFTHVDGVDLNRNHLRTYKRLPTPDIYLKYPELWAITIPRDLKPDTVGRSRGRFHEIWNSERSQSDPRGWLFHTGVMRGQNDFADGILYTGTKPSWSYKVWKGVAEELVRTSDMIAAIDGHSGLGPTGTLELLLFAPKDGQIHKLANTIFDPTDVKPLDRIDNDSKSSLMLGTAPGFFANILPRRQNRPIIIPIAMEMGVTQPFTFVLEAKVWRKASMRLGDTEPGTADAIRQIREAFCPDDPAWEEATARRADGVLKRAIQGLGRTWPSEL